MRQTSSFTHRVSPCLYPVFERWSYIIHSLQRHSRRISVTTVSCTFQMRTVYHIAAESQAFHCILNHIMNRIQIGIRTFKSSSLLVISMNLQGFHPFSFWLLRKIRDTHISKSVMVEFISEIFPFCTTGYINITFTLFVKLAIFR